MTQATTPTPARRAAAADSSEMVIRCMQLSKMFRDFWMRNRVTAVDRIDLDVRRGEVFGLLGPNGSGKSTTIKMILGLLYPTAGQIAVFGRHPRDVQIKKDIGYLPEETYLYRFLNARETLEYYARLFHQDRRQRNARIDMLLEMVGLDKVASRPIGEYSKGMQRRIGLAQALINDPQLLILDEPTTGLDPLGTRQIKDLIVELSRRGKTILLCSHLLADVEDVCDRVAIMFGGKVRRHGTVDELLVQQQMTSIEASNLSAEDVEAVEQTLQLRGKHIDRVDQPRQKLEQLFLDIVHEAQAEGVATSGARGGGAVAAFLKGEQPAEAEGDQLIEQLSKQDDAPAPQQDNAPAAPPAPVEDVLDQLVTPEPAPAPRPTPARSPSAAEAPRKPAPPQEDDVDNSVLDSLLGDSDEDKPRK